MTTVGPVNAVPTSPTNYSRTRGALAFAGASRMGDTWFVNSNATAGLSTGGYTPWAPALTLIQGQTLAQAGNNDIVYVGPGHAETITGAAGMTFSKAGVTYEGMPGIGRLRPVITFSTSTAAQMIVSGAQVTFRNIVFDFTGIDAIVAAISVTGADVTFDTCEFICNSATAGCVLGILTAATADRFTVTNCRFLGAATNSGTTTTAQIQHESGTDYQIIGNYFTGKMTQAILNTTNTVLRGVIANNLFVVGTGTAGITMKSTSTPFIAKNNFNVASGTAPIVAAAGFVSGNNYSAAAGVTAGTASTF